MAKQTLKPGQLAPESGIYNLIGPRGGETGRQVVSDQGKPLAPTPKQGQRYVIAVPAKHKK